MWMTDKGNMMYLQVHNTNTYCYTGGIEVKGKTKGTMITMKSGGRTC